LMSDDGGIHVTTGYDRKSGLYLECTPWGGQA